MIKKFSDITIKVGNLDFQLNKIVLCKIPFFEKAFGGDFKEEKIINLDFDPQHFILIMDQLYDEGTIEVKKVNENYLNLFRFLSLENKIVEFEENIVYKMRMKKGDSQKRFSEDEYEYCIATPSLKGFVIKLPLGGEINSPLVKFHNLLCGSVSIVLERRNEPFVKEALDLFYRKEIERIIVSHENHPAMRYFLILYDKPLMGIDAWIAMSGENCEMFSPLFLQNFTELPKKSEVKVIPEKKSCFDTKEDWEKNPFVDEVSTPGFGNSCFDTFPGNSSFSTQTPSPDVSFETNRREKHVLKRKLENIGDVLESNKKK